MQSTIWPPGGRHSILKCSIFTHCRCFFSKADKNSIQNSKHYRPVFYSNGW